MPRWMQPGRPRLDELEMAVKPGHDGAVGRGDVGARYQSAQVRHSAGPHVDDCEQYNREHCRQLAADVTRRMG
jgi:hypothetical protein